MRTTNLQLEYLLDHSAVFYVVLFSAEIKINDLKTRMKKAFMFLRTATRLSVGIISAKQRKFVRYYWVYFSCYHFRKILAKGLQTFGLTGTEYI